jgi:hypothetical protein
MLQILSQLTWTPKLLSSHTLLTLHSLNFFITFFPHHMLISYRIAAGSSTPPISTIKSNNPSTAVLYKTAKNPQPLQIHLEDGNCNVCQKLDKLQHITQLIPKSQTAQYSKSLFHATSSKFSR